VFATRNATGVLVTAAGLMLLAGIGIAQLRLSNRTLDWFPDDEPVKIATEKIDAELGGSMVVEVLVDTGLENGLHDPALLAELDRIQARVSELRQGEVWVGKALSIVDVIKEIHVALNEGRTEAYVIPEERRLIAQELLLFENSGSDDLEDFVDPGFRVARFTMKVPNVDGSAYLSFGEAVTSLFGEVLGDHATVTVTGLMTMMSRSWAAAIETITSAYVIALLVITVLMTLVLGSLRLGLLAMIPNLLPIVLTLGLMGGLGVPLDMFSLLIGSIALGLAVDDTIHFMHGFRRCYEATGDVEASVRETLQTTGQALLFTSIVLALGFFIYVFSTLSNLTSFGLLTAFAIAVALLADILVAPALMSVAVRYSSLVVGAEGASHEQAARATG
jgi:predicted RND superfamily exporter protein